MLGVVGKCRAEHPTEPPRFNQAHGKLTDAAVLLLPPSNPTATKTAITATPPMAASSRPHRLHARCAGGDGSGWGASACCCVCSPIPATPPSLGEARGGGACLAPCFVFVCRLVSKSSANMSAQLLRSERDLVEGCVWGVPTEGDLRQCDVSCAGACCLARVAHISSFIGERPRFFLATVRVCCVWRPVRPPAGCWSRPTTGEHCSQSIN